MGVMVKMNVMVIDRSQSSEIRTQNYTCYSTLLQSTSGLI